MDEMPGGGRWMIANGDEVTSGDFVATEFHPDEVGVITAVGERGLPVVEVTAGPYKGRIRNSLYPGQMLTKVNGRR